MRNQVTANNMIQCMWVFVYQMWIRVAFLNFLTSFESVNDRWRYGGQRLKMHSFCWLTPAEIRCCIRKSGCIYFCHLLVCKSTIRCFLLGGRHQSDIILGFFFSPILHSREERWLKHLKPRMNELFLASSRQPSLNVSVRMVSSSKFMLTWALAKCEELDRQTLQKNAKCFASRLVNK